jgi:hypothetical protein
MRWPLQFPKQERGMPSPNYLPTMRLGRYSRYSRYSRYVFDIDDAGFHFSATSPALISALMRSGYGKNSLLRIRIEAVRLSRRCFPVFESSLDPASLAPRTSQPPLSLSRSTNSSAWSPGRVNGLEPFLLFFSLFLSCSLASER